VEVLVIRRSVVVAFTVVVLGPATAEARDKKCVETGDTVGEKKCSRYGDAWAMERQSPLTFRFGFRYGEFTTDGAAFAESFKSRDRPRGYRGYRFRGQSLGVPSLGAFGGDGGATVFLVGQLYVGLETGFLLGAASTASFSTATHGLRDDRGIDVMIVHAGAPIGYRIPLGRASLRGEVLAGGIVAGITQKVAAEGAPATATAWAARGLVEPRVAADVWFTQHISFGAYAGVNLVDANAPAFGVSLTWHARAFDGDPSLW
jgi:hypothetical protein